MSIPVFSSLHTKAQEDNTKEMNGNGGGTAVKSEVTRARESERVREREDSMREQAALKETKSVS